VTVPPEREIGEELVGAMHQSTGSYELVIAAIAAAALGFWIDYVVGTMPVFTLIFAIAGFVGAGYSLYLKYQQQMQTANADRTARRSQSVAGATEDQAARSSRSDLIQDPVLRANAAHAAEQVGKRS